MNNNNNEQYDYTLHALHLLRKNSSANYNIIIIILNMTFQVPVM